MDCCTLSCFCILLLRDIRIASALSRAVLLKLFPFFFAIYGLLQRFRASRNPAAIRTSPPFQGVSSSCPFGFQSTPRSCAAHIACRTFEAFIAQKKGLRPLAALI